MGQLSPARRTPGTPGAPKKSANTGRRLWFDIHSWAGLKLSVLMAFVCLTGTLAVFAHEIDWLLHPEIRVQPGETRASWGDMVGAVQTAYPDWTLSAINAPWASRFAAKASVRTPDGRNRFVWVDPYRGHVTGDTQWFNAHRFLRNIHRHLMMPVQIGVPIVSSLALALLLTFVTSLVIYKKWWRGFFARPRPERQRRFWGDLHRLMGVWSLWFVLLMALTGIWYLVESLGGQAPPHPSVTREAPPPAAPALVTPAAVDEAVALARRDWPGLDIQRMQLSPERGAVTIEGQAEAWLVRDRANAIGIDVATTTITDRRSGQELNVHQRIAEMADPLHFGTFGGLTTQVIWFLFGVLLTGLSLTGVYLYGLRASEALRSHLRREARAGATT